MLRRAWKIATMGRRSAAALQEKGYDHKFVFGEGEHNNRHATAILPDALRWLWRDYPK
jgi:enterochelin esterase family protein